MSNKEYKDLQKFSKSIGIAEKNLVKAFEIEREFHHKVLNEPSQEKRKELYSEVYKTVHKIYGKKSSNILTDFNPKRITVKLFRKELENKSVLDVGCGEGFFLASIADQLNTKNLCGVDTSIPEISFTHPKIDFIEKNIIDFELDKKFDVIFSDQVLEHIAPADLPAYLNSIKNALNENGTLILMLPNSHFGPSDVTRIIDCSQTGKVKAEGTHLNESTYTELIPVLKEYGFLNFKTLLPLPKVKQWVPNLRLSPYILKFVENCKLLMWLIRKIKYSGFPLLKFDVIIICSKK